MFRLIAAAAVACVVLAQDARLDLHDAMVGAADALLGSLAEEQRAAAQLPISDSNRVDWHYVPRARRGLAIRDMTSEQRVALHALLRTGLSARGYLQANGVMELDQVLHDLAAAAGRRADHRDPELYYVTIFGEPGPGAWGWRLEGHHLSLNFSAADGGVVGATPLFLGANPAEVRHGHRRDGFRVLGAEGDAAWALLDSLSAEQRGIAHVSAQAPRDVILSPGVDRLELQGLPVAQMSGDQRELVRRLLFEVVHDVADELALVQLGRIGEEGFEQMRFAWMGGLTRGEPHYWRLHAGTFVVEYDNVQNGANHVHLVWRDLETDFGGDVLREHVAEAHGGG